jgi:hypothetical protein
MMRRSLLLILLASSAAALGSGCGLWSATIEGEVTVDGKPLEKGIIVYAPLDGKGQAVQAEIRNGHYSLRTAPGQKLVQISAPVLAGQHTEHNGPGAPMVDITEESLPAIYNSASQLKFEATAGSNTKDWSVESRKKKS